MKASHILLLAVALAACADESGELSAEFRDTPLRHLRGVHIGMTGRELKRVRPDTKYAPYLGRQEQLPGYMVAYRFPSATTDTGDIAPDDRLIGVVLTQSFASEEEAASAWRAQVGSLSSARRKPDTCERFASGGMQARWFAGRFALAIGAFGREPAAPLVGPRVLYAVSPMDAIKQPDGATPFACPN